MSKICIRLLNQEWSKDFLRSTNAREEIDDDYFTKNATEKLQEQMLGNEWATEYLQNVPLVEAKLHLSHVNGGKTNHEGGMTNGINQNES